MNFAEGAQTVSSFKFAGRGQQETWVGDLRTTLLEKPPAAPPARHRSLLPSPRQGRDSSQEKKSKLSSNPTVSANLPGRAAPARHGGTQLMSRTNYEAVADFAGHWLHRAQVSLLTGNRSNQIESHPKKNLVRAWCGPGAGLVRAWCGPGAGLVRAWCGPGAGLVRAWCGLQDRSRGAGLACKVAHGL